MILIRAFCSYTWLKPGLAVILFTTLLAFVAISCHDNTQQIPGNKSGNRNVFDSVIYDKVVAYSYDGEGGVEIINVKGKLSNKIRKQVQLNKSQTTRLANILCDKATYGGPVAACFDPHFGVVFYKKGKPMAYVSVCLDCNSLVSSIELPSEGGFSSDGAKKIVDFEKQLNF